MMSIITDRTQSKVMKHGTGIKVLHDRSSGIEILMINPRPCTHD
jgi:hypothetical protein